MTDKKPSMSDNTELSDQLEELTGHRKGKPIVIPRSANHKVKDIIGVNTGTAGKDFKG